MKNLIFIIIICWTVLPHGSTVSVFAQSKSKKSQSLNVETINHTDSHLYNGLIHKMNSEFYESKVQFEKFIKTNPKEPVGYYQLAKLLVEQYDNPKEALKYSKEAFELDENNKFYRMLYADILAYTGKFEKGAKLYEVFTHKNKNYNVEYFTRQLLFYEKAGKTNKMLETIDLMEKYTSIDKSELDEYRLKIYTNRLQYKKIEKLLLTMIAENPENYYNLLRLAKFYDLTKKPEKAKEIYARLEQGEEQTKESKMAYYFSLIQKDDTTKLVEIFEDLYLDEGDTASMVIFMNTISSGLTDVPNFLNFFLRKVGNITAQPNANVYGPQTLFIFYNAMGVTDSAIHYGLKSYEKGSEDISIYEVCMSHLLENKEYDKVMQTSEIYNNKIDSFAIGYYFQGWVHTLQDEPKEALVKYKKSASLCSKLYNETFKLGIYLTIASIYSDLKDKDSVVHYFELAKNIDENDPTLLNNYAYYLASNNLELDKAFEMSSLSNELIKNQPSFLDTYGYILYLRGDYKESQKYLRKAIEFSEKPSHELWEHIADVEQKLGNIEKANDYYQNAIDLGADKESIKVKMKLNENE